MIRLNFLNGNIYFPSNSRGIPAQNIELEKIASLNEYAKESPLSTLTSLLRSHLDEHYSGGNNLGPVCIIIHGHGFDPFDQEEKSKKSQNPHLKIYQNRAISPLKALRKKAFSWPSLLHLDFDALESTQGLAICIGWKSGYHSNTPTPIGDQWENIRSEIKLNSLALNEIIRAVYELIPQSQIHFFCHGIGSEILYFSLESLLKNQIQCLKSLGTIQLLSSTLESNLARTLFEKILTHTHPEQALSNL
jgi:hypothetical protein